MDFTLPDLGAGERWEVVIDTAAPLLDVAEERTFKTGRAGRGRGALGARPQEGLLVPASPAGAPSAHLPAPGAPCRSRPTGCSCTRVDFGVRRRGGGRALPRRPRRHAPVLLAVPAGGAGLGSTATTSSTTAGSTPSWAASRPSAGWSDACRAAGLGHRARRGAQPHGGVSEPESQNAAWWAVLRDGRTSASTPPGSTSTGTPPTTPARCWCRCSAPPWARSSTTWRCSTTGSATTTTRCRSPRAPGSTATCSPPWQASTTGCAPGGWPSTS